MRMRKCICGKVPILYTGGYGDEHRHVYCPNCGLETLSWCNGNWAQMNWNKLIARLRSEKKGTRMKKRIGRPPKLGPNPKTIGIRVSAKMKKAVEEMAKGSSMTMSEVITSLIKDYFEGWGIKI